MVIKNDVNLNELFENSKKIGPGKIGGSVSTVPFATISPRTQSISLNYLTIKILKELGLLLKGRVYIEMGCTNDYLLLKISTEPTPDSFVATPKKFGPAAATETLRIGAKPLITKLNKYMEGDKPLRLNLRKHHMVNETSIILAFRLP